MPDFMYHPKRYRGRNISKMRAQDVSVLDTIHAMKGYKILPKRPDDEKHNFDKRAQPRFGRKRFHQFHAAVI